MGFATYDLTFLVLFVLFLIIFLYRNKKKVKREMKIAFLYKTQFGVKFIDKFSKKFKTVLIPMQLVIVGVGYILMIGIVWLLIETTYIYFSNFSNIFQYVKAPPLAPLIPYFPKLFGLESIFPPLHFTYFIIAIGIVALTHEFAHGIFARLHNIRIKSTGFLFLGPLLGAFVEQDDKQMEKAKKFPQLSILGAGVFANIVMVIIFGTVAVLMLLTVIAPAGVKFNTYASVEVEVDSLDVAGVSNISEKLLKVSDGKNNYLVSREILDYAKENEIEKIGVYLDSPAINAGLEGAIVEINGVKTTTFEELADAILKHEPGDIVKIKTASGQGFGDVSPEFKEQEIEFSERDGKAFLGIGFKPLNGRTGLVGFIFSRTIVKIKDPFIFYKSSWGDFGWFVYYLLWWIVVINALVALFNMLPVDPFDGGRFFYLTVLGITGSKKVAKVGRKLMIWFILFVVFLLMSRWIIGFFG